MISVVRIVVVISSFGICGSAAPYDTPLVVIESSHPHAIIPSRSGAGIPRVRPGAVEPLLTRHDLVGVNLRGAIIDRAAIEKLAEIGGVKKLDLSSSTFSDADAALLCRSGSLEEVDLSGTFISDVGLRDLVGCKSLRLIVLYNCWLCTERGVRATHKAKVVRIYSEVVENVSNPVLPEVATHEYRTPQYSGCEECMKLAGSEATYSPAFHTCLMNSEMFSKLSQNQEYISSIKLRAASFKNADFKVIPMLSSLKRLQLDITSANDETCELLSESSSLETIVLAGSPITGDGLRSLMKIRTLRTIDVSSSCKFVEEDDRERCRRLRPDVEFR